MLHATTVPTLKLTHSARACNLSPMRILLANTNCITDPTAGAMRSLRTIIHWLAEAGHKCHVLTTSFFGSPVPFTIEEHLGDLGVSPASGPIGGQTLRAPPVVHYDTQGVPITLLLTEPGTDTYADRAYTNRYRELFDALLDDFDPDLLIAAEGQPAIRLALAAARKRGVTTVFNLRTDGYYDPSHFESVDHVLTCSRFLTELYRQKIGLTSTAIEPPIPWSEVLAPKELRRFVTFVHPAPHKGLFPFARLADMLGSKRPDIPILVIQSGCSAGALNTFPDIDFSQYPHIVAAPAVDYPADYFALTRLLLVPSVWVEGFGRVAAEAMINGVPPLVSDRGALSEVVGGDYAAGGAGRVLPLPDWLTPETFRVPAEEEIQPWFDAVCELWDDGVLYERIAARGLRIAEERFTESVSKQRHIDYFTSLKPGGNPLH